MTPQRRTASRTGVQDSHGLLSVVTRPHPACPRCGRRLVNPTPDQVFCSRAHGKADNADKWAAAPDAVWDALVSGAVGGLYTWDEIRDRDSLVDSLTWAGKTAARRKRRVSVMRMLRLRWDSQGRRWVRGR